MNTDQNSKQLTTSLEQSSAVAAKLARSIQPPFTLELVGDLGGGKTTFVKAFAAALGIEKTVVSPTFTIRRSYEAPHDTTLEHFDLYRLDEDDIVLTELTEACEDRHAIVAVEWAAAHEHVLPSDRLIITFEFIDEVSRKLTLKATGPIAQKYLDGLE